jgi:hypothetical protein
MGIEDLKLLGYAQSKSQVARNAQEEHLTKKAGTEKSGNIWKQLLRMNCPQLPIVLPAIALGAGVAFLGSKLHDKTPENIFQGNK